MPDLNAKEYSNFENIKHNSGDGSEFWYARELANVLEYTEWRNFTKVIDKAVLACKNSGNDTDDHFVEVNKMIQIGKGKWRNTGDGSLIGCQFPQVTSRNNPTQSLHRRGQVP